MQTETRIKIMKPTMTMEEMTELLHQRGSYVYYQDATDIVNLEHVVQLAREIGYVQNLDLNGFSKPILTVNDIKALAWLQEHSGEVRFCSGYISFKDEGIEQHMACPFQHYVIVKIGIADTQAGKTIEDATLQLQKRYYGLQWSEQLKADLYA
jgi:hypothetical protein